jgi:hypothetical protein
MNFFQWIFSKRTTITGYLGVLLGVIELNSDTVGQWVAAPKRGTLLLVIGMLTAGIGHYNSRVKDDDQEK